MAQKAAQDEEEQPHETSFWDTLPALLYLFATILLARWRIWEPFKIPSGSMEPTLFGHEDYGDRIVTNKLAYVEAWQVCAVIGAAVVLIGLGVVACKGWRRWWKRLDTVLLGLAAVLVIGGILFAWARDAVASDPKRFDVVVFQYNSAWMGSAERAQDINYIKRLIGLPGDQIVVSGGDLFLRKNGQDEILRKWKIRPGLQETVWYPIAKAWSPLVHELPKPDNPNQAEIQREIETLRFPWKGAEPGTPGATLTRKALQLDGTAPVTLTYAFPATNVYLKQGRWPFRHVGCPAAHLPETETEEGVRFRDPAEKSEYMTAYVTNTWEGVQCPNCKEIMFPLSLKAPEMGPRLTPEGGVNFFYGGDYVVGDLKLDVVVEVETPGSIELEVGSNLHRALWRIPSTGASNPPPPGAHEVRVSGAAPELSPGKHTLSLAYVDATVIAVADGRQIDCQEIEVAPLGRAAAKMESVARLSFTGLKGTVSRLDICRDLYYPPLPKGPGMSRRAIGSHCDIDEKTGDYVSCKLRAGEHCEYWMMGDNSPSSSDSRVWGVVPKERLVGRASFVWWPPSRWRFIK